MQESDIYIILENYYRSQNYNVHGEVCGCDLVAIKENEIIIVELKKNFNTKLLYQCTRRLALADKVYACFLKPGSRQKISYWSMVKSLCRRLNIGAIVVDNQTIKILAEPKPFIQKKSVSQRKKILKEFQGRKVSQNIGGVTGKKLETAYLESAIKIAVILSREEKMTAKELQSLGTAENTYSILYQNHYGWFDKKEKGVYILKDDAPMQIIEKHPKIWRYYMNQFIKK